MFFFLCVWVWQLDQMERWTRAVTASVDGVLGLSLVSHKTFCNQTIYLWNHWDYKMLKYCIKLLLGAIDLYFTINEIIIKAMPYNKWKFSILTCKQVYVKNCSTKGASGKCWRKLTRGKGGGQANELVDTFCCPQVFTRSAGTSRTTWAAAMTISSTFTSISTLINLSFHNPFDDNDNLWSY